MVDEHIKWPIIGMTVEEAAEVLRVHPQTIRTLIKAGDLPARKVGVGWRISHKAAERWLEEGKPVKDGAEGEEYP